MRSASPSDAMRPATPAARHPSRTKMVTLRRSAGADAGLPIGRHNLNGAVTGAEYRMRDQGPAQETPSHPTWKSAASSTSRPTHHLAASHAATVMGERHLGAASKQRDEGEHQVRVPEATHGDRLGRGRQPFAIRGWPGATEARPQPSARPASPTSNIPQIIQPASPPPLPPRLTKSPSRAFTMPSQSTMTSSPLWSCTS